MKGEADGKRRLKHFCRQRGSFRANAAFLICLAGQRIPAFPYRQSATGKRKLAPSACPRMKKPSDNRAFTLHSPLTPMLLMDAIPH
jgi:hypothetical protein